MYYDLVEIDFLQDYKLKLTFSDGREGSVDFKDFIDQGGIFARLADKSYFNKAYVNKEWGVLCWPDDLDIASETLYQKTTGQPLPDWMQSEKSRQN